jgi:ribosome biogenesis GTPase
MSEQPLTLSQLGWRPYFQQQLTLGDLTDSQIGRVIEQHRSSVIVLSEKGQVSLMPLGGLLMDTPEMRELQLSDCEQGVSETFSEITELALQCRFGDCSHNTEPGCAIQKALTTDLLDERRFASYQKLMREQAFNGATLAEKKAKDKAFGKMIGNVQSESRSRKKGY